MTKEVRFSIGRRRQAVRRRRELLARGRLHQVRRNDDDELRFLVLEIAAAKECAEDWDVLSARQSVDILLRLGQRSPARAREPPDGSSTTVLAWRVSNTGFWPINLEISLTLVSILRLMRPSESTTGVKLSWTPNFLNATELTPSADQRQ